MDDTMDDAIDLSLKEFFIIVHYKDCDPGNEYEIISESQLVENSWETLERGVEIAVKFGNAKIQGFVVLVSDDCEYLKNNFKSITEEFSADLKNRKKSPIKTLSSKRVEKSNSIKCKDKYTQTDNENDDRRHDVLQAKYDNLLKLYEGLTSTMRSALHKADVLIEAGSHKEKECGLETKKEHVLRPINGNQNKSKKDFEGQTDEDEKMVYIGTHKTQVPKEMYDSVNWLSYSAATRKLLISIFPRKILATHSLTGKPSPAFLGVDKQTKMRTIPWMYSIWKFLVFNVHAISRQYLGPTTLLPIQKLDPIKISDIVEVVSKKCHVSESIVRSAITTKCADENKMYRKRMAKRIKSENDENEVDPKKFKYV